MGELDESILRLTQIQKLEHWDIFVRAYYGVDTPDEIAAMLSTISIKRYAEKNL